MGFNHNNVLKQAITNFAVQVYAVVNLNNLWKRFVIINFFYMYTWKM